MDYPLGMMNRIRTGRSSRIARACAVGACVLAAGLVSTPAMGQSTGSGGTKKPVVLQPPIPPSGDGNSPWMPVVMMFVFVGVIVGVNFIPSKRGHQD